MHPKPTSGGTPSTIRGLFLDIGGVLLTDGWAFADRRLAEKEFGMEPGELEPRHGELFATWELGKMSLVDYLDLVVFQRPRPFSRAQFQDFIFARSRPHPEMIGLMRHLKEKFQLKIGVLSNEVRELNQHRIQTFQLDRWVDFFVSSCYVHLRKPDPAMFKLAIDLAQVPAAQMLYIENTPMFTEVAAGLGLASILHQDENTTKTALAAYGLIGS